MIIKDIRPVTKAQLENVVENGLNEMFRQLQEIMGVASGDVAGVFDMGDEADDVRAQLIQYMSDYINLERIYAPEIEVSAEGFGSNITNIIQSKGL